MALYCISGGECAGCMECMEGTVKFKCCDCGEKIYEGDPYYKICGGIYCEDCVMVCREEA